MTATDTDTEILDKVKEDVPLVCDHYIVQIRKHDFTAAGGSEQCEAPAKWVGMVHSLITHDRSPAFLCDEHKDIFLNGLCPNPVCQAPRLTEVHPL